MLTAAQLTHLLEPVQFEGGAPPTWRYQWGPFMFVLEESENIDRVRIYTGTVAILDSSSQFRVGVPVRRRLGDGPAALRRNQEDARMHALLRMVDYVHNLNPDALREASDFLREEEAPPVTETPPGKPALERLTAEEDTCC